MNLFVLKLQIVYTAMLSGMMVMYVITLGSYFNYILKHHMVRAFQDYSLFRQNTKVQLCHFIVMVGQETISIVSLMFNYRIGWFPLVIAVIVPIVLLALHVLTGFGKVENLVNSAESISGRTVEKYLAWNMPLHIVYALLYAVSALLLL